MDKIKKLREERAALVKALAELIGKAEADNGGKGRDLNQDEQKSHDEMRATIKSLDARIVRAEELAKDEERANASAGRKVDPEQPDNTNANPNPTEERKQPVIEFKRHGALKAFHGENAGEKAYRFGRFVMATAGGDESSRRWCTDHGIQFRAMAGADNAKGGALVPDEFLNQLIDLRETYGVFRQNARVIPMSSDAITIPRRTGGVTAYAIGENTSITESNPTVDTVNLVAQKWGAITLYPSELGEDAAISIGDMVMREIAYAFANKEDESGFNGDGTSTYHGVTGVRTRLTSDGTAGTDYYYAGGSSTSGKDTWPEVVLGDFHAVLGLLPAYAHQSGLVKWYCSSAFFYQVMQGLMYAAGGNTVGDVSGGASLQFLGYPVVLSQVFPSTTAVSQLACVAAALPLGAAFGSRREVQLASSTDRYFELDQIAVRGTTRFDINVHDLGPIKGLRIAAS